MTASMRIREMRQIVRASLASRCSFLSRVDMHNLIFNRKPARRYLNTLSIWGSRKFQEFAHLVGSTVVAFLFLIALCLPAHGLSVEHRYHSAGAIAGLATIYLGYAWLGYATYNFLKFKESQAPITILFYIAMACILIAEFGLLDFYFQLLREPTGTALKIGTALYFSGATFTTVGYGDLLPGAGVGQLVAVSEAILASTHSVFFVLLFLRGMIPVAQKTGGNS
jgi:hypothetical protein